MDLKSSSVNNKVVAWSFKDNLKLWETANIKCEASNWFNLVNKDKFQGKVDNCFAINVGRLSMYLKYLQISWTHDDLGQVLNKSKYMTLSKIILAPGSLK